MQDSPDPDADADFDGDDERTLIVPPEAAGMRLDRWLAEAFADLSRSRVKALILEGLVSSDGEKLSEPKTPVKPGDEVIVRVPPPVPATPEAQALDLAIVHEDAHLIVVDKPAGMAVHPAPGTPDGTLVNALLHHCAGTLSGIGGVARPGIVHRLDKETSGLIVAAKTDAAHAGLADQFAAHSAGRVYAAVVWGWPSPAEGVVDAPIGRDARMRKRMAVVAEGRGKPAVTHYALARRLGRGAALLDCRLETGRTHQIRVHLTHIGHPLIGDPLYGRATPARRARMDGSTREAATAFPRQALHAGRLDLVHPVTGIALSFEAPLPADMRELIAALDGESP